MSKSIKKEKIVQAPFTGANAEFNALPKMKKRLFIAMDILQLIRRKKFLPGFGYGSAAKLPKGIELFDLGDFPHGDMQEHIRNGMVCDGCAKAAIIMSRANLGDKVKVSSNTDSAHLAHSISREIFGDQCAYLIEALYEDLSGHFDTTEEYYAFMEYKDTLPDRRDSSKRMVAIYKNIVKNEGYLKIGDYKY